MTNKENNPHRHLQNKLVVDIKSIRKAKNLTQKDMAEKLSMTEDAYGDMEQGKTAMTLDRLAQIAIILEESPYAIFENREYIETLEVANDLLFRKQMILQAFVDKLKNFYLDTMISLTTATAAGDFLQDALKDQDLTEAYANGMKEFIAKKIKWWEDDFDKSPRVAWGSEHTPESYRPIYIKKNVERQVENFKNDTPTIQSLVKSFFDSGVKALEGKERGVDIENSMKEYLDNAANITDLRAVYNEIVNGKKADEAS